jgi:hypothetical protein
MYTLQGNLIHTTHTLLTLVHVCHTYASHKQFSFVSTFHADLIELDRFTTPEKKCSCLHLSARLSGPRDPPWFLSQYNHWSSALKPNICWWTCYIGLLGPFHQHVISTFNTCLQEPTQWSLTDTGEGYNLRGTGLPHHTPSTFPTDGPPLST